MDLLIGTVFGRWYVMVFGGVFLWQSSRQLGWRKTGIYLAASLVVGVVAENGAVHTGIPYTTYSFNPNLRDQELFIGSVPLMVPLSYCFMSYFALNAGRLLASGPFRTRALRPWHELLVAWMLAIWAIFVLDPVSRMGDRFYLGDLWAYRGPGFWFGLPLGSQLGFALTSGILLFVLHRLAGDAPDEEVPEGLRRHPHLVSLLTYHGQVFHMTAVAFYLGEASVGGAGIVVWIPAAVITAVHWSTLRIQREHAAPEATTARARTP